MKSEVKEKLDSKQFKTTEHLYQSKLQIYNRDDFSDTKANRNYNCNPENNYIHKKILSLILSQNQTSRALQSKDDTPHTISNVSLYVRPQCHKLHLFSEPKYLYQCIVTVT